MATERLINNCRPDIVNSLHLLIFGSTLLIYNLPIIINSRNKNRFLSIRGIFFSVGFLLTITSLFLLKFNFFILVLLLGIISFGYSVPVLPFKNKKRLRDFGWLKTLVLAGVWTIVTTILPILFWQKAILNYPFEIMLRFVLIYGLCILFDLRDLEIDTNNKIYTLPKKIGIKNSYYLVDVTILVFMILSIFQYYHFHILGKLFVSLITAFVMRIVVYYLQRHPSNRAYLALADGIMFFYSFLALL